MPSNELLQWADGFVLVYSITDRVSFNYAKRVKQILSDSRASPAAGQSPAIPNLPLTIIGNKCDMVHLRQVATEEGEEIYTSCLGLFYKW